MYFVILHQNFYEHCVLKRYEVWTEHPVETGRLLAGS
jgi:hypothetical protein